MSVIKKMRKQKAVYWKRLPDPDEFGVISWESPVEIPCRWDDQIGQFVSTTGQTMPSLATVYVDREMKLGDKLMKGPLDTNAPNSPLEDKRAYEIQGFETIPNFKAKEFLYIAHL